MANKNYSAVDLSYGSASGDSGFVTGSSGDTFYIRDIDDASRIGLFCQTTGKGTKLVFSTTDVDYTGAGAGDQSITIAATSTAVGHVFVGPFDGTRLLVETSTGSYIQFSIAGTTATSNASLTAAAFQM